MNVADEAIAFLIPLRDAPSQFDLFVLCCIHGIDLNSYTRTGPAPFAEKLSDNLIQKSHTLIQSMLHKATKNLWRDCLWKKYMVAQPSTADTMHDFNTLRILSHVVPISKVDIRFASILFDPDPNMNMNWTQLESDMRSDPIFGGWTDIGTRKLIYLDVGYLVLQHDEGGVIRECELLLKNPKDDPLPILSFFGNFFLLWIYNNANLT
jgi:hypothetical protein